MAVEGDSERRVGVEIEFAGLDTHAAGRVLADALGGALQIESTHRARLTGSALGTVELELDTRYAHPQGKKAGLIDRALDRLGARDEAGTLLSSVVPVEIITEPIGPDRFHDLDCAIQALRDAGATGTEGAPLYAFGMHLNIALTHGGPERAVRIAAAYAFAERWLRDRWRVDPSRRVVPFIDPYPKGYRADLGHAMADGAVPELEDFIRLYQSYNPSRNRGLDLWPLLGHLAPELAERIHGGEIKNPRPAFHYRWPDSRVGEPGWSPRTELARWQLLEAAADDPDKLERLRSASVAVETGEGKLSGYMAELDTVLA